MAKFDIFNEDTWQPEAVSIETAIRNKALGAIGQMVHQLRMLKTKLEDLNKLSNNEAYQIAENIRLRCPDVYKLMDIKVVHSGGKIAEALQNVNKVLEFWKDTESRAANWRSLLPILQQLKPYLDTSNRWDYEKVFQELIDTTVTGNAAWDLHLVIAKQVTEYRKRYEAALSSSVPAAEDSAPESYEYSDDDYEADDEDTE